MSHLKNIIYSGVLITGIMLVSCRAKNDYPGREYAPNMYHSVAYEPLKQINDPNTGQWVNSSERENVGEYFNSNPYNPDSMNMRLPVKGTIPRRSFTAATDSLAATYFVAKHIHRDSIEISSRILKNPVKLNDNVVKEGQTLFISFCAPCHGETGMGDGAVGQRYGGVPTTFNAGRMATLTEGHIYHTITHGRGRMWPYASQLNPDERWKIVHFVQTLQKPQ